MARIIQPLGTAAEVLQGEIFAQAILDFARALTVNGALSVEQVLTLPRNAVVEPPFTVTIKAGPADWTTVKSVSHLRQRDISGTGQKRTSVVIDFGVMRTVSAVGLTDLSVFQIIQVKQWAGTSFMPTPLISGVTSGGGEFSTPPPAIDTSTPTLQSSLGVEVPFPGEVRTDRLQIDLIGQGTDDAIGAALLVKVPDLPADLDLRINAGKPVWNAPGTVAAGTGGWAAAPNEPLFVQYIDISAALTAMLAEPAAAITDQVDLHIVLAARSPGALELDLPDAALRTIRHVANVPLASDTIVFASEGRIEVPLQLPDYAISLDRVSLTATANLPPERVMPPVGPDAATLADGSTPLAEMLLDPTHSACVALPHNPSFAELIALRFPLRADSGGAELHVALLTADPHDGDPGDSIPGAITKPITLDAATQENWVTLSLARPLPLDNTPLYAQLVARRGRIRWALTASAVSAGAVFTGPPAGPWQPLPPLGDLAALRGRVRIVAHAKREAPVAPLKVAVNAGTPGIDVTPTPKGVATDISGSGAGLPLTPDSNHQANLDVTSSVNGSITLSNVVVTVAKAEN